ncbi:hypothetical protein ACWCPF_28735 [Streptomyces sp. NPDC001858]
MATPALASGSAAEADGPSVSAGPYPGEPREWNPVTYSGGQIRSQSTIGEARDNRGNIMHAWRGADNDFIWISLNNGGAYQLPISPGSPNAQTYAPPTVIWTDDGNRGNFRIFHTGRDGDVWQHRVQLNASYQLPAALPYGAKIPRDTRTHNYLPVAATALPGNSFMLAWNSQSNDDVWAMYYDAAATTFQDPRLVPGALSYDAPSLAAQIDDGDDAAPWNQIALAFRGIDGNIYMTRQTYGASNWTQPRGLPGANSPYAPSIALSGSGYGAIAITKHNDNSVGSWRIDRNGNYSEFSESAATGFSSGKSPLAVVAGNDLYYVISGRSLGANGAWTDGVSWKRATNFGSLPKPPTPKQ